MKKKRWKVKPNVHKFIRYFSVPIKTGDWITTHNFNIFKRVKCARLDCGFPLDFLGLRAVVTIKRMCGLDWHQFLPNRRPNIITRVAPNSPRISMEFPVPLKNPYLPVCCLFFLKNIYHVHFVCRTCPIYFLLTCIHICNCTKFTRFVLPSFLPFFLLLL